MLDSISLQLGAVMDLMILLGFWFVIVSILVPILIWLGANKIADEVRKQGEMTRRYLEEAEKKRQEGEDHQEPHKTRDRQH